MFGRFFNKIKGDRKYFAVVFFILLLIILIGIASPYFVQHLENNWNKILSDKILLIQSSINSILNEKENKILEKNIDLKNRLRKVLNPRNNSYGALIRAVNNSDFDDYSVEILAPNGRLIAWNSKIAIPQNDILPLSFPSGHIHFYDGYLTTYLTVTDTILSDNDLFYFVISLPIEKHYTIKNPYFEQINFSKELSNKFKTQINLNYSPFSEETRDGRKYSFDLLNKQNDKIGNVTFFKPTLNLTADSFYQLTGQIQSILIIIAALFLAIGFRKEFIELKYRLIKILILALYCFGMRLLIYKIGFPSNIIQGKLVDPAYFSSTFGDGIVKSPIEFFITVLFALIIAINVLKYLVDYLKDEHLTKFVNKKWLIIFYFPITFIFLLTLRALSSAVRSIIFDSTLRYFKEPNLIPNLPSIIMNLNLLMMGTALVILMAAFILILISFVKNVDRAKQKLIFLTIYVSYIILGILFIYLQNEPLITPLLSFIFISIIFLVSYEIVFGKIHNEFNFVYLTLAASVISITLLNYFNLELEKASLKTTAVEINRPNDNLLRFLLEETLTNSARDQNIISDFYDRNSNFDADAFKLWANSSLQRESLNSSLTIWDRYQNRLGGFNSGINLGETLINDFKNYSSEGIKIIEKAIPGDSTKKIFIGIIPLFDREIKVGYITASVGFDLQNLGSNNIPDFLESNKNIINSVIDVNQLKIFEFSDSKLTHVYGDIYPSRIQISPILNAQFSPDNEVWQEIKLNDEFFYAYILKTKSGNTHQITAVLTKEKRLSWNLFNFFKIFLIHSIFIIFLLLTILILKFKNYKYSFRAQLLIAFLFISIIPVIVLAIYNRQIIRQRTESAIQNELSERLNYVENIINEEIVEIPSHDYIEAFNNAGNDLGITFTVYEGSTKIFNSKDQYYKVGLFSDKLNPEAYYQLNYLSYREFLTQEKIENFYYDSFYKKVTIDGRPLIMGVNDAFNKVRLTYSVMDIDVFMFGIYSFATLVMILLSTFLANRISLPIRRLTKATASIAHGDLNVELNTNVKGEMKELLSGFNFMTKELQKNQTELAELERENAWKEMAKQVAHEIKNPLTPMKLAVQQLIVSYRDKNKNFDSIFEKVSNTILSQIENLSLIASEFSRFARMPNYKIEEVDLIPIIKDTINLFVEEQIKIETITKLDAAIIEADKSQFRRLLINLIRNSIQASANKIVIKLEQENDKFILIVSDNGKGIPSEIQEKIFELNFTTKNKGMGLGLKLAKRFIEGINGNIILLSKENNGATFKITLPKLNK